MQIYILAVYLLVCNSYIVQCYFFRYDITQLLLHLWTQMSCRESIIQQAGTQKFSSFLGAIFDTLLYQLNDSMTRITNVHRMELEKENGKITMYM